MRFLCICLFTVSLVLTSLPQTEVAAQTTETTTETQTKDALEKAHTWVLNFLIQTVPPGRKIYYPEGQETQEEALERYNKIAWDIVHVAYDPGTQPVFVSEVSGRSRTATVWLGIMLMESGFMKHVDLNIGEHARGDSGLSWCMMQLRIGKGRTIRWNWKKNRKVHWGDPPEEIAEGLTGPELIGDRQKCIEEGNKLVLESFKTCESLPLEERLMGYTIGKCKVTNPNDEKDVENVEIGRAKSKARMDIAIAYFMKTRCSRGFKDQDVVAELGKLKTLARQQEHSKSQPALNEATTAKTPAQIATNP